MKRVLVTGVFNVIHPGHVRMLRFARECGDYLIVAVQSDLSATPPIHVSGRLRLEGVLSNTYVDEAFLTNEGIEELIQRLQPSILVKGREHENTQNPESTLLEEYGGELLFDSGESFFSSLDLLRKEFYAAEGRHNQLPYDYMKRHKIDPLQLKKILKKFSKLRVAVVGDLIMDEYITCDSLGMSQEDPTIVVTPVDKQIFIGGAGIVAAHSASLGGEVNFISVAGDDLMYKKALSILTKVGVNTDILIDRHRPTTLKQRFRSKGKTLLRVSHLHQSDINQNLQSQVVENLEKIINDIDLLVFSDFNYGCLPDEVIKIMTEMAKRHNIYIVADSQSSSQIGDVSRYKNMNLLTPTEREARISVRDYNSGLVVLSEKLRNTSNVENILLKLGEEGVLIHATDEKEVKFLTDRISALNSNPKDVSGAGDSMLITSAMTLCVGGSIWDAALLGSIAAGLQVGKLGNEPLKLQELQASIGI